MFPEQTVSYLSISSLGICFSHITNRIGRSRKIPRRAKPTAPRTLCEASTGRPSGLALRRALEIRLPAGSGRRVYRSRRHNDFRHLAARGLRLVGRLGPRRRRGRSIGRGRHVVRRLGAGTGAGPPATFALAARFGLAACRSSQIRTGHDAPPFFPSTRI